MPTYSGGLGVLAGDTLRAAADAGVPMVGITLLHRKGYFAQHLDNRGWQQESPVVWDPAAFMRLMQPRIAVEIEGRRVLVAAWRYMIRGIRGHTVPVYFLDTDLPENDPRDRRLTDHLYGDGQHYRICQEVVLGIGGVEMLRVLRHDSVRCYHMNEGHAAFLTIAVLEAETHGKGIHLANYLDVEAVRDRCIFTTHTPVPAGHDQFPVEMVEQVLGSERASAPVIADVYTNGLLNMTYLALRFSRRVNGVAMRHAEVSRGMFPEYPVGSITNGVHAGSWTSLPFQSLYDQYIPDWRVDNFYLRYAVSIPHAEIARAHNEAKAALLSEIERRVDVSLDPGALTIGFARRATAYKRMDLIFHDVERLKYIARTAGPIQFVFSGKAHPKDELGKRLIQNVYNISKALGDGVQVVYLEGYDMALARTICAGVDVWLNTPRKPLEASGTSGMKAALNGVPSLSILDGWWVEGCVEGKTGWAIGDDLAEPSPDEPEVDALYDKLERVVGPLFYQAPDGFIELRRDTIALNGSFFNAQRMLFQYVERAYPQFMEIS